MIPGAALAEAWAQFAVNINGIWRAAWLALAGPALAAGAALAADGLADHRAQQALLALQAAMLWLADTTGLPSPNQPLMPDFTL